MNLRNLRMEDVASALGHVTTVPRPNYSGMTADRADDLNEAVRDIGRDELISLVCILATRCATYRDTTPLSELWSARSVDAKVTANIAAIAEKLRGEA